MYIIVNINIQSQRNISFSEMRYNISVIRRCGGTQFKRKEPVAVPLFQCDHSSTQVTSSAF